MKSFTELRKNLKKDRSRLKAVKLAVLGDSATQLLVQAVQGYGYEIGYNFEILEADYDQIDSQIFNAGSELYRFKPEFVVVFHSVWKLLAEFWRLDNEGKAHFANSHLEHVAALYGTISSRLQGRVVCLNYPEIDDAVFGNYANKTELSFLYQLRRINLGLMDLARKSDNMFIADLAWQQGLYGAGALTDRKVLFNTDIVFSLDFLPAAAKNLADVITAILGDIKKCVILDLDNTLWGGVIGDDGWENIQIGDLGTGKIFTELQSWLKQLKERGIILAVCSKNDEDAAREPFLKHPDMVLRLEDIAVFVANWENKADNINYIQSVLNIGFDSMVFLDDSPFEREMVRTRIPGITVPELPEDPAEYLPCLRALNLFETASFTADDGQRTAQYRQEAQRAVVKRKSASEDDFLSALAMRCVVRPFDRFSAPRVAQLTQRSNQFNLRTVRYTAEDIGRIARDDAFVTLSFSLEDRFGDYGLISAVILEKRFPALFIDTWIMSCRVLARGVECLVLNEIVRSAQQYNFRAIVGEYLPTAKNKIVKDLYRDLGFCAEGSFWRLNPSLYKLKQHFISIC